MNVIVQLSALNSLTEVNIISMLPGDVKTEFAKFKSSHRNLSVYSLLGKFMNNQVIISRGCVVAVQAVDSRSLGTGGLRQPSRKDGKCYKCQGDAITRGTVILYSQSFYSFTRTCEYRHLHHLQQDFTSNSC